MVGSAKNALITERSRVLKETLTFLFLIDFLNDFFADADIGIVAYCIRNQVYLQQFIIGLFGI